MTTPTITRVLVVDDFEGVAKLVKEAIEDIHYEVRTARSAEDGYRAYLRFRPDIVITDIEMAGRSGFDLVDDIHSIDPQVKVIFMSGYTDRLEKRRRSGVDGDHIAYLPKPFSLDDLYDHLDHFEHAACH